MKFTPLCNGLANFVKELIDLSGYGRQPGVQTVTFNHDHTKSAVEIIVDVLNKHKDDLRVLST